MLSQSADFETIVNAVERIRVALGIRLEDYPIDIFECVKRCSCLIVREDSFLTTDIRGFLIRNEKPDLSVIIINSNLTDTEKRYALAHELVHFFCHPCEPKNKAVSVSNRRNANETIERQANIGAQELLAPCSLIKADIANATSFYGNKKAAVKETATIYKIPTYLIA